MYHPEYKDFLILIAAFGGFAGGVYGSRGMWAHSFRQYVNNIDKQCMEMINKFGITAKNGKWEMKDKDGTWTLKEKSDT